MIAIFGAFIGLARDGQVLFRGGSNVLASDLFSDPFLDELPEEPVAALIALCEEYERWRALPGDPRYNYRPDFARGAAVLSALLDATGLASQFPPVQVPSIDSPRCEEVVSGAFATIQAVARDIKLAKHQTTVRARFQGKYAGAFAYEFSDGDLKRVQQLLNELRAQLSDSEVLTADHKARWLPKLEGLQRELHKRVSDLDRFYGLVVDARVMLGKFGKDAKPIVDRVREIAQIVWHTQARAEKLPSDASLLFFEERA